MRVAVAQFAVSDNWHRNAQQSCHLMEQATLAGAALLVLPEAILARSNTDPHFAVNSAQHLEGEFIAQLRGESQHSDLTTVFTLHTPGVSGRAFNTLVALKRGDIVAHYHKVHLYDAFNVQESKRVDPGDAIAPLIYVEGMAIGLMTCYDLRFPDMALSLALRGAQAIVLPAAWLKGPYKEQHWQTLLSARALDTTCYMIASGECGEKNIGQSLIIDPLGIILAQAGLEPELILADITEQRVAEVRAQLPVLANRRFSPPHLMESNRLET